MHAAGCNVNAQDQRGVGALHFATLAKDTALVAWLLEHGANVNLVTAQGTTALMLASKACHADIVTFLLLHDADVTRTDPAGHSALHLAAHGDPETVRALLAHRASAELVDEGGRTALFSAIFGQSFGAVTALLEHSARVDVLDAEGYSPLFRSIMGDLAMTECLLATRADPNLHSQVGAVGDKFPEDCVPSVSRCVEDARTPLQIAVLAEKPGAVALLLQHQADVDAQPGSLHLSPLHLAVIVENEALAKQLLVAKAKRAVDASGFTPMALAQALELAWEWPQTEAKEERGSWSRLPPLEPAKDDPLEDFLVTHVARAPRDGDVLDAVLGPALCDALDSSQWRVREAALDKVRSDLVELDADAAPLCECAVQLCVKAAGDKVQKVFVAGLGVLEEVLSDSRVAELAEDRVLAICEASELFPTLLTKCEDANAQVARHALEMYVSVVYSGRASVEAIALPLLLRLRELTTPLVLHALQASEERASSREAKRLQALLRVFLKLLSAFGLSEHGVFRRTIALPLLLFAAQHPSSTVRSLAVEAVAKVSHLSGALPDDAFAKLKPSVKPAVEEAISKYNGPRLVVFLADEDSLPADKLDMQQHRFVCMAELPHLSPDLLERLQTRSEPEGAAPELAEDALRQQLYSREWRTREQVVQRLCHALQGSLAHEAVTWTSTAKDAQPLAVLDGRGSPSPSSVLFMHWSGIRVLFFLEALTILVQDQVLAVFVASLDLLTTFCDRVTREPNLAHEVLPRLIASLVTPLLAKMQDSSSRVRKKATNAVMYVASLEPPRAGPCLLLRELTAWGSDAKRTSAVPLTQLLAKLLGRPSVSSVLAPAVRDMCLAFLGEAVDHRNSEVRQLGLQGLKQLYDEGWAEVDALVACMAPKLRKVCRKAGIDSGRAGRHVPHGPLSPIGSSRSRETGVGTPARDDDALTPTSAVSGRKLGGTFLTAVSDKVEPLDGVPGLPFAEPITDEAREFVQPLVELFGDMWVRCWYSPNWQARVAALQNLGAKLEAYLQSGQLADMFDGVMRVLNEGLGDQVVKVYTEACQVLPQALLQFGAVLEGALVRAHLQPLLLHLLSRTGDSKETVRTKTTQTLFAVLATHHCHAMTLGRLLLDSLSGSSMAHKQVSGSVAGWLCRLSVLRDLVRDFDLCAGVSTPDDWLRALTPGLEHPAVSVRHATLQLFVQVYRRCTSEEDEAAKLRWVKALPPQMQAKLKSLLFKQGQEHEDKLESKSKTLAVPACLVRLVGDEQALAPLALPPNTDQAPAVVTAAKLLIAALKQRSPDLETFEGICEVLKYILEHRARSTFQVAAQLCVALLHEADQRVSSLDLHMAIGRVFLPLLTQCSSRDMKIAIAANKTVLFLAKHPRVGAEAVARQVLLFIARCEAYPERMVGMLAKLVGEFGSYLCFQPQLISLMIDSLYPHVKAATEQDCLKEKQQLGEILLRCQQLQPRVVAECLRGLDLPKRQALQALTGGERTEHKGGELLLCTDGVAEEPCTTPSTGTGTPGARKDRKERRQSRYRKDDRSDGGATPDDFGLSASRGSGLGSRGSGLNASTTSFALGTSTSSTFSWNADVPEQERPRAEPRRRRTEDPVATVAANPACGGARGARALRDSRDDTTRRRNSTKESAELPPLRSRGSGALRASAERDRLCASALGLREHQNAAEQVEGLDILLTNLEQHGCKPMTR